MSTQANRAAALGAGYFDLIAAFMTRRSLSEVSRRGRYVEGCIRRFAEHMTWRRGSPSPAMITADAIAEYLRDMVAAGRAAKTVHNHRGVLSLFCRFLVSVGVLASDPCEEVPPPRLRRALPVWLSEPEVARALEIAEREGIYAEVALALNTGLRRNELRLLEWSHVDWERRALLVRHPKNGRERSVPLTTSAVEALERQRAVSGRFDFIFPARRTWRGGWEFVNRPRAVNWWRAAIRPLQQAIAAFGVRRKGSVGTGWHALRHTFGSRLVQRGVSVYKVATWMGHSDVRTTQLYAHLAPGYDADIDKADAGIREGEQGCTRINTDEERGYEEETGRGAQRVGRLADHDPGRGDRGRGGGADDHGFAQLPGDQPGAGEDPA